MAAGCTLVSRQEPRGARGQDCGGRCQAGDPVVGPAMPWRGLVQTVGGRTEGAALQHAVPLVSQAGDEALHSLAGNASVREDVLPSPPPCAET